MSEQLFDAASFYETEIFDFLKRQNTRGSITLWGSRQQTEQCRNRVLCFANRHDLIIETERLSEHKIKVTYTGNLFSYNG